MQPALRAYARLLPSRRSRAAPGARPYRDPGARPARADEDDDKAKTKTVKETVWGWDLLNDNKALWLRSPADVSEAEYTKFYQALAKARALTLPPPRRRASGTCAPRSRTPQVRPRPRPGMQRAPSHVPGWQCSSSRRMRERRGPGLSRARGAPGPRAALQSRPTLPSPGMPPEQPPRARAERV